MEFLVYLLVVFTLLVLVGLLLKQTQRIASLEERVNEVGNKFSVIQQDVSALCASGLGVDERVGGSERRIRGLVERLEELEESETFEHLQEFQGAIELAQQGAEASEIVEKCHLTLDEAALLIRLHKS